MAGRYTSWGRYPAIDQQGREWTDRHVPLPSVAGPVLPFGNGRSYGDVCLNPDGLVLGTRQLDRFLGFDAQTGVLRCEAGVLLADILRYFVPRGWFLPVTPGTQFATVGGAIANDVHGKNHHRAGTFGCFVEQFELLRTDGSRCICSATAHPELFAASIGGMGLTGFISWADIRLRRIAGNAMDEDVIRFANLDEFFTISGESEPWEYTVAWVDCVAKGAALGRGLFMRANHADADIAWKKKPLSMPLTPPFSLVNNLSLRAFNALYYRRQGPDRLSHRVHYDPYFYPLDSIGHWNRMYGPRGFLQYQCAIPMAIGRDAIADILQRIARSGSGSFLAVLKIFGDVKSPGLLSFPMPGVTLALDFPNRGEATQRLFASLDEVVVAAGGRMYPAKDAHMDARLFQAFYPQWQQLETLRDPGIMSGFWKRVSATGGKAHG